MRKWCKSAIKNAADRLQVDQRRSTFREMETTMEHIRDKTARRQRSISRLIGGTEIEFALNSNVRALGEQAFEEGGIEKMHTVFWRLQERGVHVGYSWDGIGGWFK